MTLSGSSKAAFDAAATAAGAVIGTDIASKDLGSGTACRVQPLNMKGLKIMVWDLNLDVPQFDVQALANNMFAAKNALITGWTQT